MNKYISTFCLCATLLIFSCTDPNLIGLDVQPPSDGISVLLTSNKNNLKLSTISEDSLRSDETSTLLLGEINDPIFGYNQAAFSTQFMLPFSNVDVGSYSDSLTVDSIVLGLSYTGSYGINDVLNIMVYEISESIYKDSVYYSNQDVTCVSNAIYSQTITVNTEDSVMVGGEMKVPQLRLKLDISLGDKILIESGRSNLEDNAQFVEFFKGLYVSASSDNDGVIAYLSPISANSKLSIYYHSTNVDSLSLDFSLTGDATRINLFEKDTSYLFNQADTSTNTYVQSMAGHKTVIEIQHLDTLKTFFKDKAINRVNLSFELDGTDTADFPPHGRMYLVRVDNEGKDYFLTDYIVEGEDHFGGKLENGKYTFNITRYFLQLLNNEDYTNKLYLVAAGGAVNANRTILPKDKISFNIIYTDL
ncbi:MAG TPA: DUF4270 domain-containing protein [Flavobacteriales bacterium]|nr:DUF4270 domain-containing protein [Flavobacteriales bacterium]